MTDPADDALAAELRKRGWFCAAPGQHGWSPVAGQVWTAHGRDSPRLTVRAVAGRHVWVDQDGDEKQLARMVTLDRFAQWVIENTAKPSP